MSGTQAIDSLVFVLQDSERELAEAVRELGAAQQRATRLVREVEALRAALARRRGESVAAEDAYMDYVPNDADGPAVHFINPRQPTGDFAENWSGIPRTDAVERALLELAGPEGLSPNEIHKLLQERGRSDIRDHVSAALTHLKNNGRAHRSGRAKWLPGPGNAETPGATGVSVNDWSAEDQSRKEGGLPNGADARGDVQGAMDPH